MHVMGFIQDLATIMIIAGVVTVLFHRWKQPVVLGYIIAGIIIGPHTPPFELIHEEETIKTFAELGVVFLMFSLGLEFSLKKLAHVGVTALVAATAEIILMIWIGYEIGRFFAWSTMDSLFLGSILAISSTTIIIKALDDLGMKGERFAHLIFGILIVEDILAIGIISLLSAIAISGSVDAGAVVATLGRLSLFLIVAFVLGILIVPRLLAYVARFQSNEMLLIAVLGLLFGFCLLVVKLDYSIALGAFVIGAVMAESRQLHVIERLIEPVKDMFSAIFFVAIGLLFDPRILVTYALPVAVITLAVVVGKVVSCTLGTFLGGHDGRTSLRVGMGLAQIGEFSFIIASLGITLSVTSGFLYPIAVTVSAITTLLTPYLIKLADPLSAMIVSITPAPVTRIFGFYTQWLQNIQPQGDRAMLAKAIQRSLVQVLVNFALVVTIFLCCSIFGDFLGKHLAGWPERLQNATIWSFALVLSLPFLIAAYRKLQGLSLILSELTVRPHAKGEYNDRVRRVLSEVIPIASMAGMLLLVSALSTGILPPTDLLILVLICGAGLAALLWRRFVRLHSRLQNALLDTFERDAKG